MLFSVCLEHGPTELHVWLSGELIFRKAHNKITQVTARRTNRAIFSRRQTVLGQMVLRGRFGCLRSFLLRLRQGIGVLLYLKTEMGVGARRMSTGRLVEGLGLHILFQGPKIPLSLSRTKKNFKQQSAGSVHHVMGCFSLATPKTYTRKHHGT